MTNLRERLRLVVVTDRKKARESLPQVVAAAVKGGATAVQVREKDLGARELVAIARAIREITLAAGALLIVNDRVDVALAVGADGVQLGWTSLTASDVRQIAGNALLIGVSTHVTAEIGVAEQSGADFVTFGPVFDTPSKRGFLASRGCRGLAAAVKSTALPVVALGGIRVERVADVRATGACGIASVSRIMTSRDPERRARLLVEAWTAPASAAPRSARTR